MTEIKVNRQVSFDRPGSIVVTQGESTNWLNIIERADPIVEFSSWILKAAADREPRWPAEILRLTPPPEGTPPHLCAVSDYCFIDWKLECAGANGTFVYIIKQYDWERHCWIGAWPD